MEENIKSIKQLLGQIKNITKSYERLNEANGGNFNIFSILRIESDEVTTHSRFIAELLNPKGVHGFEDQFLKLFVETLELNTNLTTNNCQVIVEAFQGKVTGMPNPTGGSIDILIKENTSNKENVIMIENKIYAGEQEHQLLRYHNAFPKGKLLFLTLFENEKSEQKSSEKTDYIPISYEHHIIKWLEECQKVAVNNPTLRETLTQYINLIKKLTNQNINTEMSKELAKLFTESEENYNSLLTLNNLHYDIYKIAVKDRLIPVLKELEENHKDCSFYYDESKLLEKKGESLRLFSIENDKMKSKNISIVFAFNYKTKANSLIGGFCYIKKEEKTNHDYSKLRELFSAKFKPLPTHETDWWPCFFPYWNYMHWEDLTNLKNIIHGNSQMGLGNLQKDLKGKVEGMLDLLDDAF